MFRRLALAPLLSLICVAGTAHAAFQGGNGNVIYTSRDDSTALRQLVLVNPVNLAGGPFAPDTGFDSYEARWSPNGGRVIMLRHNLTSSDYDIWVANADGSGLRQVTTGGGEMNPSWSPDGHHIVYVGADALYTINVDDPADTPHKVPGTDNRSFTPAWSPDGGLIAYEHIPSSGPWEIDVIAPDGSGEHAIVTAPSDSLQEVQPAWSPDGSRMYYAEGAFVLGCNASPPFQIKSVPRTGGTPVPFSQNPSVSEYGPAPSPDGRQIAFTRCDDPTNDNDHIYVANIDGSGAHALSSGDHYDNEPDWQPTAPQISSPPGIQGSPTNNQLLTATTGAVDGATSTTLQFERCDAQGAACVPIPSTPAATPAQVSAASISYKLTSADIGSTIRAHEVETNAIGTSSIDSAPTSPVVPARAHCSNVFAGTAKADRIRGSSGSDRISGGRGRDKLFGFAGADCISGGAGNDVISGGKGNDSLSGGAGNDRITAGPGRNRVSGGAGNDVINVRNHRRDVVNCGKGRKDRVVADRVDRLRGCERVVRRR